MSKEIKDLDAFEAGLGSALRSSGHLFPATDREAEMFLANTKPETLPEKYQTPDFVFQETSHSTTKKPNISVVDYSSTAQSWSLAARNGKELPQSILDKMKEDKKNSQKK